MKRNIKFQRKASAIHFFLGNGEHWNVLIVDNHGSVYSLRSIDTKIRIDATIDLRQFWNVYLLLNMRCFRNTLG